MKVKTNKCKVWLAFALSVVTGVGVFAAPFDRTWNVKQPDGRLVQIHGWGDEFSANMEVGGYTVIFDLATKSYVYATRSAGGKLESSGLVAGRDNPASSNLAQHLRPDEAVRLAERAERYKIWDEGVKLSSRWEDLKATTAAQLAPPPATATGISYAPPGHTTVGNKVGLCLLVDFPDDGATVPRAEIDAFCNGDNYVGYGNNGSVKKYFQDVSNQRLTYNNIVTVYLRVPHPKTYYNDPANTIAANELVKDALDVLKALPNYATEIWPQLQTLTVDGGGKVVACNVFYAGTPDVGWAQGLWPHSWSLYEVGAQSLGPGVSVWNYQMTDVGNQLTLGTFCHENGHMLCGYPDIYDYGYDSVGGAGGFCLMNSGGHGNNPVKPCGYLRMHSGWLDVVDLGTLPDYQLTLSIADTTIYKYTKPSVPKEYFIFENRQQGGRDANIPGSGIAIWHCDEDGDKDDQRYAFNTLNQNYEVQLMQADNLWHFNGGINSGEQQDLYYYGNPAAAYTDEFSDSTAPSARWWDGSLSELFVGTFSVSGDTMTMLRIKPPPEIASQSPLPEGRVGSPYWFQFSTKNRYSNNNWSVVDIATLPPGLTLSTNGWLSGLPTVAGTNIFEIVVNNGSPTIVTNTFELVILPVYTAPFVEGFNGAMEGPRTGWNFEYVSNAIPWRTRTGSPSGYPSRAFEGERNAYLGIYTDSGSASLPDHITRMISPMIQFGPGAREISISFAYYLENRSIYWKDSLCIYYKTAWSNEWVGPIGTYNATSPQWLQQSITLPESAAGKGVYFAFEGYAFGGHGVSLDDVRIEDPVPPLQIITPTPLEPALTGTNYMPFVILESVGGYTNSVGATSYGYALVNGTSLPNGFFLTPDGVITGRWDTPITLKSFDVEVTDLVGGGKATNTLAFAVEYPRVPILQENFLTSNSRLPSGWTIEYVANRVDWRIGYAGGMDGRSPPSAAHSDSQYAFFFGTPSAGTYMISKLVSPVFDLTQMPNNSRLVFWHFMQKWSRQDQLRIYYRNVTGGPWTMLEAYTNNVTSWTKRSVQLPSPSRTYQIAFEGMAKSGYGVCVDSVSITDDASSPVILTRDTLPTGFENFYYQTSLVAVGGVSPYSWAVVSNSLPRGLRLDPLTGVISGIPVGSTQTVFSVSVTGVDNKASTNSFSLKILPPGFIPIVERFTEATLPSGWQQENVTAPTVAWRTVMGTYCRYISAERSPYTGSSPTNNLCLYGPLNARYDVDLITPPFDLGGCTNTALSFQLCMKRYMNDLQKQDWLEVSYDTHLTNNWKTLVNYDSTYFNSSNAVLFSVWTNRTFQLPEPSATYRLKFRGKTRGGWGICIDDLVITGERTAPPLLFTTPDPLPDGTSGMGYSGVTLAATGGTSLPYTWRIVGSDIFPPGLTLNSTTGVISGTPTQQGIYTFGVTVQDANNVTATRQYTLQILSSGLTPYQAWVQSYYPFGGYPGDDVSDSGDGIPNLIKYGMGLNPILQNTGTYILGGMTNVVGDGSYLYFVYRRSLTATDLVFSVTGKTNLADVAEIWTTNNIVEVTPWEVGQTGVWSWVYNLHTTPITNAPQRFLRLEVER